MPVGDAIDHELARDIRRLAPTDFAYAELARLAAARAAERGVVRPGYDTVRRLAREERRDRARRRRRERIARAVAACAAVMVVAVAFRADLHEQRRD
jgi:hypothetical protein